MKRRLTLAGISLVLIIGIVAVVSAYTVGKSPDGSATPRSRLVGHHMRDFLLGGLNGGTIRAPWEDDQPSVLVFFASYCGPCQGEMPKIADYIRTHDPSPVVVLAIDAIDVKTSAQAMIKRDRVTFPVAFDPNGVVTNDDFGFGQIPESVFIGSRGIVEKVYYGAISAQALARGISALKASHK